MMWSLDCSSIAMNLVERCDSSSTGLEHDQLLQAVTTEVEGRLAQSLHNAVWLTLGMERQDYRVDRPWSATVVQEQQVGEVLATGTRIIEVFDRPDIARQLLILGEPGSGKTTMMLELAQDLLERARGNKAEPTPVLLSLSAWKDPKQPIFDWLSVELNTKYGLRQDLAKQWLEKNQLLPLLDGLDEVAPQHQQACALALNAWLTGVLEQKPCGVLICCRREEFEQVVREPLNLYGAIYLQALPPKQIEEYFAQFHLRAVWQTVHQDATLQDLLTKPLFLSIFGLVTTQHKFSIESWQLRNTSERKIEYLLDTYWEAMIERELILDPNERRRGVHSKTYGQKLLPNRQAVRRSLVFAAKTLNCDSNTELLIEKIQLTALLTKKQQWAYRLIFGLTFGLILGLAFGFILFIVGQITFFALIFSLFLGLIFGLALGLVFALAFALFGRAEKIRAVEAISIPKSDLAWREIINNAKRKLAFGLAFGLIFSLINGLIVGFIVGLINELDNPLFFALVFTLMSAPMAAPVFALISGLICGFVGGLIGLLKTDIPNQVEPNQGIKNSIKNMTIISAITFTIALPLKFFIDNLSMVDDTLLFGCITFSLFILIGFSFLEGGGQALSQHLALRIVLAWNRYAPFRYDLLLDYCTERLLLQRIGGRYRFMHKLLQDHFAKMDL